jgi:hypothetical protein
MSTGEVIGLPNDTIGGTNLGTNTGNFGFEAGTGSGGTTGGTTQTGNQYFQDSVGNVYDADGTLIYYNPSNVISGGTMDGGGYDPNAEETESDLGGFFQNAAGDIYDSTGSLVLEYGNGYYYEPDTGNYYDSNFDVVDDSFSFFRDFMGIPAFDSSEYDDFDFSDLFDYGNYTSGSTTYIKDGGSVRGGLATPLFKNGGSVPRFADGGTSFTDQVVANQMPQSVSATSTPVTTQTNLTNPTTLYANNLNVSGISILNDIANMSKTHIGTDVHNNEDSVLEVNKNVVIRNNITTGSRVDLHTGIRTNRSYLTMEQGYDINIGTLIDNGSVRTISLRSDQLEFMVIIELIFKQVQEQIGHIYQ